MKSIVVVVVIIVVIVIIIIDTTITTAILWEDVDGFRPGYVKFDF
jgi:hypothetical protein